MIVCKNWLKKILRNDRKRGENKCYICNFKTPFQNGKFLLYCTLKFELTFYSLLISIVINAIIEKKFTEMSIAAANETDLAHTYWALSL